MQSVDHFEELGRKFRPLYLTKIAAIVGWADAEDVLQQALIQAWQHLGEFRTETGMKGLINWTLAIAHNCAINHKRSRARRPETSLDATREDGGLGRLGHLAADVPAPEDRLDTEERESEVRDALARLPMREAEILRLRFREGLKFNEIAELHSKPEDTIKTRFYKAMRRMAASFL